MNTEDLKPLREAAIKVLEDIASDDDYEIGHWDADRILCDLLAAMGAQDVVDAWEKVGKWYA